MVDKCPFSHDEYMKLKGIDKWKYYKRFIEWMKLERLKDKREIQRERNGIARLNKKHGKAKEHI